MTDATSAKIAVYERVLRVCYRIIDLSWKGSMARMITIVVVKV